RLVDEALAASVDSLVAYRGITRWTRAFVVEPLRQRSSLPVRDGGVYVITGGLGGIGLALARRLAQHGAVKFALIGRSGLSVAVDSRANDRAAGVAALQQL